MLWGVVWFAGGLAVTLGSYLAAVTNPFGGHYLLAYGAIVSGIVQFFIGRAAAKGTDTNSRALDLLNVAAELESVDRTKAGELYQEILKNFPGTRASEEARRNLMVLRPEPPRETTARDNPWPVSQ